MDFKAVMPCITSLRNESLRPRHFLIIQQTIGKAIERDKLFTLGNLLEMNVSSKLFTLGNLLEMNVSSNLFTLGNLLEIKVSNKLFTLGNLLEMNVSINVL